MRPAYSTTLGRLPPLWRGQSEGPAAHASALTGVTAVQSGSVLPDAACREQNAFLRIDAIGSYKLQMANSSQGFATQPFQTLAGVYPAGVFLSPMNEDQVAEFITSALVRNGPMLGARLGSFLSRQFPGIRFWPGYPGLFEFVQRYCRPDVSWTKTQHNDWLFQYVGQPNKGQTKSLDGDAWAIFLKSTLPDQIAVDRETGEIRVFPADASFTAKWHPVAKITTDENRSIAEAFLAKVEETDRPLFAAALGADSFWPAWSRLVNQTHALKYRQAWGKHRFDQICAIFHSRLRKAGVMDDIATLAIDNLIAAKERHASDKKLARLTLRPPAPTSPAVNSHSLPTPTMNVDQLRRLVQAAVETMCEEDLRRLNLPLGDVIDALRQIRS